MGHTNCTCPNCCPGKYGFAPASLQTIDTSGVWDDRSEIELELVELKRQFALAREEIARLKGQLDAQAAQCAELRAALHLLRAAATTSNLKGWAAADLAVKKALALTPSEAELRATRWRHVLELIVQWDGGKVCIVPSLALKYYAKLASEALAPSNGGSDE